MVAKILIDPETDAEFRAMKPPCSHCGCDKYTRFRYFNNKNAVLNRSGAAPYKVQARFACRSPECLAKNPGKSEVEFTHKGTIRGSYDKRQIQSTTKTKTKKKNTKNKRSSRLESVPASASPSTHENLNHNPSFLHQQPPASFYNYDQASSSQAPMEFFGGPPVYYGAGSSSHVAYDVVDSNHHQYNYNYHVDIPTQDVAVGIPSQDVVLGIPAEWQSVPHQDFAMDVTSHEHETTSIHTGTASTFSYPYPSIAIHDNNGNTNYDAFTTEPSSLPQLVNLVAPQCIGTSHKYGEAPQINAAQYTTTFGTDGLQYNNNNNTDTHDYYYPTFCYNTDSTFIGADQSQLVHPGAFKEDETFTFTDHELQQEEDVAQEEPVKVADIHTSGVVIHGQEQEATFTQSEACDIDEEKLLRELATVLEEDDDEDEDHDGRHEISLWQDW